jgi:hypothetical protein
MIHLVSGPSSAQSSTKDILAKARKGIGATRRESNVHDVERNICKAAAAGDEERNQCLVTVPKQAARHGAHDQFHGNVGHIRGGLGASAFRGRLVLHPHSRKD